MTCTAARTALLEADLDELRGTADTPLAVHLRDCAACRAAAERIIRVEGAMDRRLGALAPGRDIVRPPMPSRRPRPWRWAVPLAAAAGIVALILTRPAPGPPPGNAGLAAGVPRPSRVAVEAPAGRNVAVFATADPDIVIIWFF